MLGLDEVIAGLQEEIKRLKGETYCAYCGERFPLDAPDSVEQIGNHIQVCSKHPMRVVEAQVERLKTSLAIAVYNNGSLTDEFNRAIALIREHCPKLESGYSWLLEGIDLLAQERDAAQAEVAQLKTHTWEQERAAVVAYCRDSGEFSYADSIESGEHWPEGGTP